MAKIKARASSLDLLGRQQIAGIPNALNELFKNAHDAYADNVDVDFFRDLNMLYLRDNGLGMTKSDFEGRWLTLGTESKMDTSSGIAKPYEDNSLPKRETSGEKGIGRLAIASIGSQVLVVTRARRGNKLEDYVVSFINWSMFELPGVDLEEIEIPVRTYKDINDISSFEIDNLISKIRENLSQIELKTDSKTCQRIKKEVDSFKFDSKVFKLPKGASIENGGTAFIIQPVSCELVTDIDDNSKDRASNLHTTLCGFTNTAMEKDTPIRASFFDHKINGSVDDLIGSKEFFTPDDYKDADHHIKGGFDEYGNFKGEISIYHMKPEPVEFIFNKSGSKTSCGPFSLQLGFLQGNHSDSLLEASRWHELSDKYNRMGGAFVYKDNIRMLPFGSPDYDYFGIERRRNLRASTYFYNHRRMLMAINITRKHNPNLVEKAGREGFMVNAASRQFKNLVEEFLVQSAFKYFNDGGALSENYITRKTQLNKEAAALDKRKKTVAGKRRKLQESLKLYFDRIEKVNLEGNYLSWFDKEVESVVKAASNSMLHLSKISDLDKIADDVIKLESETYNKLREIDSQMTVLRPAGVGLGKKDEKDYAFYLDSRKKDVDPILKSAEFNISKVVSDVANAAKIHLDAKIRLEKSISMYESMEIEKVKKSASETVKAKSEVDKFIKSLQKERTQEIDKLKTKIAKQINEFNKNASSADLDRIRHELEEQLESTTQNISEKFTKTTYSLQKIIEFKDDLELDDALTIQAMESKMETLQEDFNDSLENIQLGLAIKVINHEFSSNVKGIRDSIRSLNKWSKAHKDLKVLYDNIRDGFDHLDNYLNLFTPLEQRMRRRKAKITGVSICDFIQNLYGERLERHEVKLQVTDAFRSHSIDSFASSIYPVFINLIDNSIHWLSASNMTDRVIVLDSNHEGFVVSDNGPGISELDKKYVFDFGFTKKPGGGGMGLYIAKTVLNREGLDIQLSDATSIKGTEFIIKNLEG